MKGTRQKIFLTPMNVLFHIDDASTASELAYIVDESSLNADDPTTIVLQNNKCSSKCGFWNTAMEEAERMRSWLLRLS